MTEKAKRVADGFYYRPSGMSRVEVLRRLVNTDKKAMDLNAIHESDNGNKLTEMMNYYESPSCRTIKRANVKTDELSGLEKKRICVALNGSKASDKLRQLDAPKHVSRKQKLHHDVKCHTGAMVRKVAQQCADVDTRRRTRNDTGSRRRTQDMSGRSVEELQPSNAIEPCDEALKRCIIDQFGEGEIKYSDIGAFAAIQRAYDYMANGKKKRDDVGKAVDALLQSKLMSTLHCILINLQLADVDPDEWFKSFILGNAGEELRDQIQSSTFQMTMKAINTSIGKGTVKFLSSYVSPQISGSLYMTKDEFERFMKLSVDKMHLLMWFLSPPNDAEQARIRLNVPFEVGAQTGGKGAINKTTVIWFALAVVNSMLDDPRLYEGEDDAAARIIKNANKDLGNVIGNKEGIGVGPGKNTMNKIMRLHQLAVYLNNDRPTKEKERMYIEKHSLRSAESSTGSTESIYRHDMTRPELVFQLDKLLHVSNQIVVDPTWYQARNDFHWLLEQLKEIS